MCQRRQNSAMFVARYGMLKFLRQLVAEQVGRAEGHVGVAGEVAVDLHGVGEHGHPDGRRADTRAGSAKTGSANWAMRSAMASFLNRPMRKNCTPSCMRAQSQRLRRRICGRKSRGPHDRPGDQVREEQDEEQEVARFALGRDLAGGRRRPCS